MKFSDPRDPSTPASAFLSRPSDLAPRLHLLRLRRNLSVDLLGAESFDGARALKRKLGFENDHSLGKDEMKNTLFLSLVVLAVLPAAAQQTASPNCSANGDAPSAWAQEYAARVDGLLREVHASLQSISAQTAARRLTPEQARELKLAATRDVISRLDTQTAIYDVQLDSNNKPGAGFDSVGNASAADNAAHATRHANGTISVEELKRETAAELFRSRPAQATR